MKFGLRTPSLTRRIAARTSWKRYVRHSMGLKAPRGMGIITNPKRAMYNRVYNRTTFGIGDLFKVKKVPTTPTKTAHVSASVQQIAPLAYDQPFSLRPASFIRLINTKPASGQDTKASYLLIIGLIMLIFNPLLAFVLLAIDGFWLYRMGKKPWYKEKQAISKAKKEIRAGKNEEALLHIREAYAVNADNPDTNYLLGIVLQMTGNFEESVAPLKQYTMANPMDLDAKLVLAYSFYKLKKFKEAASLLQKFPQEYPDYQVVILLLGDSFLSLKEFGMAIEVFNRGPVRKTNVDAYLIQLHYLLGMAYKENGDKQKALRQFERVYSVDMSYKEVGKELQALKGR